MSRSYSHNALHQITAIRQGSALGPVIANFDYDANGNMTNKTFNGASTTIGYDALDRVTTISKSSLPTETYGYDHSTQRISKTVGTTASNYLYSGPDIIAAYYQWGQSH